MLSAVDVDTGCTVFTPIQVDSWIPKQKLPSAAQRSADKDKDGDQVMADREELSEKDFVVLEHALGTPCLLPERHLVSSSLHHNLPLNRLMLCRCTP